MHRSSRQRCQCTTNKRKGCCSLSNKVRRPREGFQYSAVILYCTAVGVRASRVVAAARVVISITRLPESHDTAAASSAPKQQFAQIRMSKCTSRLLRRWPATHRSVVFPRISGTTSVFSRIGERHADELQNLNRFSDGHRRFKFYYYDVHSTSTLFFRFNLSHTLADLEIRQKKKIKCYFRKISKHQKRSE